MNVKVGDWVKWHEINYGSFGPGRDYFGEVKRLKKLGKRQTRQKLILTSAYEIYADEVEEVRPSPERSEE